MEGVTLYLTILIVLALLHITWRMHSRRFYLPPGPYPLPLLGNVLQGSAVLYKSYHKLSKQYGPVFTVWMGRSPAVVLCGYEVVKDALINHSQEFSGRGPVPLTEKMSKGYGIVSTNGEHWQQTRRFTVSTLRNFGMGKRSMEDRIKEEAQYLIQAMTNTGGEAFNPKVLIGRTVNNVINLIAFGRRWDYEDTAFLKIFNTINKVLNFIRGPLGAAHITFPTIMTYLPGPHQKVFQEYEDLKSFIRKQVISHNETLNPDSPRDFIDCFLIKANEVINKELKSPESYYCQENMVKTVFELFVAGTDTTSNTIYFSLLIMIKYPHIQERVQQEIDAVVGSYRLPSVEDRTKMPYTNAVVHEVHRFVDIVPMALPHKMTKDTSFRGFTIPKGTTVIPMICSVMSDPAHWKTPQQFNPGHFLNQNKEFILPEAFMPFSAGKRMCAGEGLARMEVFLFFAALLQKFTFRSDQPPDTIHLVTLRRAFRKKGLDYRLRVYPRDCH